MLPKRWLNIVVPLPFWQQTVEYLIRFVNLTSTFAFLILKFLASNGYKK